MKLIQSPATPGRAPATSTSRRRTTAQASPTRTANSSTSATPTSTSVSAETKAHASAERKKLLERVSLYDERMRPKSGQLPPSRGAFDHKIELRDPSSKPVKGHAIALNADERTQLAIDIKALEDAGLIVRSESEWASPAFYVEKDGGKERRLVCDFRALNKLIKRNNTSLPHITELLARLGKAKFFTKIDLKSSYHQILIRPEDRAMTAFVTPIGHYEWNVLPFGEANVTIHLRATHATPRTARHDDQGRARFRRRYSGVLGNGGATRARC